MTEKVMTETVPNDATNVTSDVVKTSKVKTFLSKIKTLLSKINICVNDSSTVIESVNNTAISELNNLGV